MNPLIERLGWTLIHSLWEGTLVWVGLKLALVALPPFGSDAVPCRMRGAGIRDPGPVDHLPAPECRGRPGFFAGAGDPTSAGYGNALRH